MEMMDVKAAIKLLKTYTSALETQKVLLLEVQDKTKDDPELAEHATNMAQSLRTSYRNYSVFSIILSEKLVEQSELVLLHDDFADLMRAHNELLAKLAEVGQFLEKRKQQQSPPTQPATAH
jgi:hypothetical protein